MKTKGQGNMVKKTKKESFLEPRQYEAVKKEVRGCWRNLGMLQLRMVNDLDLCKKTYLSKTQIKERLKDAQMQIQEILDCME